MIQQGIYRTPIFDETQNVLELLKLSPILFWPTGSRVLSPTTVRAGTDFDFFTQSSSATERWLAQNGFERRSRYGTAVYPIPDFSQGLLGLWERANVDIQLVVNVDYKAQIQGLLVSWYSSGFHSKGEQRDMWRLAYKLFGAGLAQNHKETELRNLGSKALVAQQDRTMDFYRGFRPD